MWYLVVFVLGAIIGSFLNVVIYRLPRKNQGLSLVKPAYSICPKCKAKIHWYDNIPLVSFLALRGTCRNCKERISPRYFFVELINSSGYLINFLIFRNNILELFAMCVMLSSIIVIVFIDLEFMLIPDATLFLIGVSSFLIWFYSTQRVLNLLSGGIVTSLFVLLALLYKGGMGSGDVILAGLMAIVAGLLGSLYALMFASISALLYAAIKNRGKIEAKQRIPFGTFLGPAFYFVILIQKAWPWM